MAGLLDKRLLVVSGKGGVGKSAVAAAIALAAAREGKKTLVCEVNADERVAPLLGHAPVGPTVTQLEPNLWSVDVRPKEAMREYGLMVLRFRALYHAVFENRLVRYFLRFIPSLQELVMLGKMLFHAKEQDSAGNKRFDLVVLDAPATGHAISYLAVPQVILDTVPPGPMAQEAEWMRDMLVDPGHTGALVVSLPEEMPVNEAVDLYRALTDRVRLQVSAVVLNCSVAPRFSDEDERRLQHSEALRHLAHAHRARAFVSAEAEGKLRANIPAPLIRVPRLYEKEFGRQAIEEIAQALTPFLHGTP